MESETEDGPEGLILADRLVDSVVGRIQPEGKDLQRIGAGRGITYGKLYDPAANGVDVFQFVRPEGSTGDATVLEPVDDFTPAVIVGDFVSLDEGTGIVHIAPAFGDEDLSAGRQNALAFVQQVDLQGAIIGNIPVRRQVREGRRQGHSGRPEEAGSAAQAGRVPSHLPLLLALRHAPALLRQGVLVYPHNGHERAVDC